MPPWPSSPRPGEVTGGPRGDSAARPLAVIGGIVAGAVAFGTGEATSELVPADTVHFDFSATSERRSRGIPARVVQRTTALAYGILGLCLGGCLGIAGGVARQKAAASLTGGLVGAVLGAVLGGAATLWLLPSFLALRHDHQNLDMIIGMLIHGVIWGPLGAAAGWPSRSGWETAGTLDERSLPASSVQSWARSPLTSSEPLHSRSPRPTRRSR